MRRGREQSGIHTSSCSAAPAAGFMPGALSYRRKIDAYGNQLLMIIKGLFRRYERWNPVHPTMGAFWGMGIGVGCGVGWGPGFGPEVIGYVGAGCGVGFSVGFTLAGVGIGLPMTGVVQIPYHALEFARPNALTTMRSMAGDSWSYISPQINFLKKEACRLPSFKTNVVLAHQVELSKLNKTVMTHIGPMLECFKAFQHRCRPPGKGT